MIAFVIAAVGSYFMAQLFGATDLSLPKIIPWIPWLLLFILGNSFSDELLFRGLFLNKMKPSLGALGTNLVLILPFVLHYTGVTYMNYSLMFLAYLFPLAFFWARITQKTDSLWGAVLFHAGTDVSVILVIFSQL
ncbi:MAG: CPBP family glutamic-type intramembrane protease [Bacilli bacterium]